MSARGQGFEFIGGTIVPLGFGNQIAARMIAETDGAPSGAIAPTPKTEDQRDFDTRLAQAIATSMPAHVPAYSAPASAQKPSKPMNVVREAKKRRTEIRKQLRAMRALEHELAQLDRLIKAAEQKPSPAVRSLTRTAS